MTDLAGGADIKPGSGSAVSVSSALAIAKDRLEAITVKILGEVSEVSNKAGYRAVYFTIKDEKSSLPCLMWKNRYSAMGIDIRVGQMVEVVGRFSLYAAKGRMNFDVFSFALAGEGYLRMRVAQLAKKLQAEGLMSPERKRALPPYPERIGLVTSPRGAAVHDVLRTLRRRFPCASILFSGVAVEGRDAPQNLIEGLHAAADAGAEVILLVRGGGSFEDLMPFNDESLVREIASSSVPVVTGIGHEPDNSIADMVADFRASTPTAAAEAVSPNLQELKSFLAREAAGIRRACTSSITRLFVPLSQISSKDIFRNPMHLFAADAQSIDMFMLRATSAIQKKIDECRRPVSAIAAKDVFARPETMFAHDAQRLGMLAYRLIPLAKNALDRARASANLLSSRLEDLSPAKVLGRGYAIVEDAQGHVISSVSSAHPGEKVRISVSDGVISAAVEDTDNIEYDAVSQPLRQMDLWTGDTGDG